jgi:uncharacterized membrane protein (UPF0127 family)
MRAFILLLIALLLIGCGEKATTTAFGLRTIALQLGRQSLKTEVAETPEQAQVGLMFRNSLPEDQGMLFIFHPPKQANFWMRNTRIPLSIAFIDSSGQILEIHSMKPLDETIIQSGSDQVAFALETNEGWFSRHGVQPGTLVTGLPRH